MHILEILQEYGTMLLYGDKRNLYMDIFNAKIIELSKDGGI